MKYYYLINPSFGNNSITLFPINDTLIMSEVSSREVDEKGRLIYTPQHCWVAVQDGKILKTYSVEEILVTDRKLS